MISDRVLICEDEGISSLRLRTTLTRLGYEVVGVANDGVEAIEAARRLQPDAIVMDVEMPRRDGISAARSIMESCPTAILILSAYSGSGNRAGGNSGYLTKPVTSEQIEGALRSALERFRGTRPDP
jgi:AmiR/NasT family two-component response regulator